MYLVAALSCGAASLATWFLYFVLYWPYREKFDEAGRYFDETTLVVYHEQSSMLLFPAVVFFILSLGFTAFWLVGSKLRSPKSSPSS
jgi:hypothetical protein